MTIFGKCPICSVETQKKGPYNSYCTPEHRKEGFKKQAKEYSKARNMKKTYKDYLRANPDQAKLSDMTMKNGTLREPSVSIKDIAKVQKAAKKITS